MRPCAVALCAISLLLDTSPVRAQGPAARLTAPQVVSRLQARYGKAKDLAASFVQVHTDSLYNKRRTSRGVLWAAKPLKMRFDYARPERKSFISDGKTLWIYEPAAKQAFRSALSKRLATSLAFLFGSQQLSSAFRARFAPKGKYKPSKAGRLVLHLAPVKPTAHYTAIVLVVRPKDFVVEESIVVSKHATNRFTFSAIRFDAGVKAKRFTFEVPKGVKLMSR